MKQRAENQLMPIFLVMTVLTSIAIKGVVTLSVRIIFFFERIPSITCEGLEQAAEQRWDVSFSYCVLVRAILDERS